MSNEKNIKITYGSIISFNMGDSNHLDERFFLSASDHISEKLNVSCLNDFSMSLFQIVPPNEINFKFINLIKDNDDGFNNEFANIGSFSCFFCLNFLNIN